MNKEHRSTTIEMLVGLNVIDDDEYQLYRDGIAPIFLTIGVHGFAARVHWIHGC